MTDQNSTNGKVRLIFRYFSLLLSNQNNSLTFSRLVIAISFLQNIGLTLQNSMGFIDIDENKPLVYIFKRMANVMTMRYWIKIIGAWSFFPYIRIVANILIFGFFVLFASVFKRVASIGDLNHAKRRSIAGLGALKKQHTLLVPILIQYVLEMLLPAIMCSELLPKSFIDNEFVYSCKSPFNILYFFIVISWIQAIGSVCYIGFIAYLGFDEAVSRYNKLGKRNNQLDFWVMFGKVYLVVWSIFAVPSSLMFSIYLVTYTIISIHEISLAVEHVFFDIEMYIYFLTFFFFEKGVFVSFSIMNMLEYRVLGFDVTHVELIFILIIIARVSNNFAYKIALTFKDTHTKKEEGMDNLIGFCSYLSYYERVLVRNPHLSQELEIPDNLIEFYTSLVGKIWEHIDSCNVISCFCKKDKCLPDANKNCYEKVGNDKAKIFHAVFIRMYVRTLLEAPLRLNPAQSNIRLCLAEHLFGNMGHIHLAVLHITVALRYVKSFQKFYRAFKIKDSIFMYLQRKNQNTFNVSWMSDFNIEAVARLEDNYYKMKDEVHRYLDCYSEFLELLITSIKPDLNRLEKIHQKLMLIEDKIEALFDVGKYNPRTLRLYISFRGNIRGEDIMAKEIEKKLSKLVEKVKINKQEEKLFYDVNLMYNDDTAIIEAGAMNENIGFILKINRGAEKLTGYNSNELRAMNVSNLMPQPIAEKHNSFMRTAYETGITNYQFRELKLFMRKKEGYLLPISMLMKPSFRIDECELRYITLLQSTSSQYDFIMVSELGKIIMTTKRISNYFAWHPRDFEHNKIFIQCLIPMLFDFFSSVYLISKSRRGYDFDQLLKEAEFQKNLNSYYYSRLYNQKLSFDPYPKIKTLDYNSLKEEIEEYEVLFADKKKQVYRNCNNMTNKFGIEFKIEKFPIGRLEAVFVLKVKNVSSLNSRNLKPIRSFFAKKVCRILLAYVRFKKLLRLAQKKRYYEEYKKRAESVTEKVCIVGKDLKQMNLIAKKELQAKVALLASGINNFYSRPQDKNRASIKIPHDIMFGEKGKFNDEPSRLYSDREDENERVQELKERSINSASSVKGSNIKLSISNSIKKIYTPPSFRTLKCTSINLALITIVATQLLLIYQNIYYRRLSKSLAAQSILLNYESNLKEMTHQVSHLYLIEHAYTTLNLSQKVSILKQSKKRMNSSITMAMHELNQLKTHKDTLGNSFNGDSLLGYLTHKTWMIKERLSTAENYGFLLSSIELIKATSAVLRNYPDINGEYDVIFNNMEYSAETSAETLNIDPYNSFLTNYNFVITLILTSLALNSINGFFIVYALWSSLRYLDETYELATTFSVADLLKHRKSIFVAFDKKSLSKTQATPNEDSQQDFSMNRGYSKDYIEIKKPMFLISFSIFGLILILSGFYLLSLYALGFFSGEVKTFLKLKKLLVVTEFEFYSYNYDVQRFLFPEHFNHSNSDLLDRIRSRSDVLNENSYNIDKEITKLKDENLRAELLKILDASICNSFQSGDFGIRCEKIRYGILEKGKCFVTNRAVYLHSYN